MKKHLLTTSLLVAAFSLWPLIAADASQKADLPNVLLIGDSISIGYTNFVKQILREDAKVVRNKGNAQHTGTGLEKLDSWLGNTEWKVIHFNWGLWDLCYRPRDKEKGTLTTTLDQYEENLDQLVQRLKTTGAKLIWAHTTYVPEGESGRKVGDDKKYNEVAARVMTKHGVRINDLHALTASFPPDLFVKPGDVHYTKKGSQKIAEQVAEAIKDEL